MATVEHCLYCFESLAAELEGREPMDLDDVQKSYAEYTAQLDDNDDDDEEEEEASRPKKKLPALRRLVGSAPSDNSLASSTASGSSSSTSLSASTDATSITTTSTTTTAGGSNTPVTDPDAEYPLFVTWNKLSSSSGGGGGGEEEEYDLRGCIGTFEAQPLADGLSSYAVIAALHDDRFHPVTARELPSLQCAVTLLTGFEDAAGGVMDWEVGVHGIRISFTWEGRRCGATYLPDVAREQGWTREQALVSLMRKAGWEGRRDGWRRAAEAGGMKLVRYRGDKEVLGFAEYEAWREWVGECWGKKGGK